MALNSSFFDVEWFNLNYNRRYPFVDAATLDSSGLKLPTNFILDFQLTVPALSSYNPNNFFLGDLAVFGGGTLGTIKYQSNPSDSNTVENVATFSAASSTHTVGWAYQLTGVGNFSDISGSIVIGDLQQLIQTFPSATFNLPDTRIISTLIKPGSNAVSGIRVNGVGATSDVLTGIINFNAGNNIRFDVEDNTVTINAIDATDFENDCNCGDPDLQPILTINTLRPDGSGNFNIVGSDCATVSRGTTGIMISDTCAEPCCNSSDLEVLSQDINVVKRDSRTLETLISRIETGIQTLNSYKALLVSVRGIE